MDTPPKSQQNQTCFLYFNTRSRSIHQLTSNLNKVFCHLSCFLCISPSPISVCLPHSHTLWVFLNVLWWSFTGLLGSFPWPPETWPTFWVIELQNMQWKHWYFCMYILTPLYPYTILMHLFWKCLDLIWASFAFSLPPVLFLSTS